MGQPVDRSEGVVLVTDYGALDAALAEMRRRDAAKAERDAKFIKNAPRTEEPS